MKQIELEQVAKNLKGQLLNQTNIVKECNKFDKNIVANNITIIPGYKIDENSGWVTIRCLENKVRVTLNNEGIVE